MSDHDAIDVFFEDNQSQRKSAYLQTKRFKKARRKMIAALLSALLIAVIPLVRPRYIAFNSLYSTTMSDFDLFAALIPKGSPFFLFEIPVFLVFITLVFLYVIGLFSQMRTLQTQSNNEEYEHFKRLYNRFDVSVFIIHLMALYMILNAFFFSVATIDGRSMEPTFSDGDNVVMMHRDITYERFDLVVVRPRIGPEEFYVKRLIGLPGETIEIDQQGVHVDGMLLDEPYLEAGMQTFCHSSNEQSIETCTWDVPQASVFVLGDNRINSRDSRDLGAFDMTQIYGQIQYRLFPISEAGKVE